MVEAANGAGGASLTIKGNLDTKGIDRGFRRINTGLNDAQGKADGFNADLGRMASGAGAVATKLGAMAAAGTAAMTGIASQAPQVAPALAQMDVEMTRLTHSLGRALAPAFEEASDLFGDFVGWVERNEDTIASFADTTISGLETSIKGAGKAWDGLVGATDAISKSVNLDTEIGGELKEFFTASGSAALLGKMFGIPLRTGGAIGAGAWGLGTVGEDASPLQNVMGSSAIVGGGALAGGAGWPVTLGAAGTAGFIRAQMESAQQHDEMHGFWKTLFDMINVGQNADDRDYEMKNNERGVLI